MKTYVEKELLDKKLCIYCDFCVETYDNSYKCSFYKDNVSNSPIYYCSEIRDNNKCNGNKFRLRKDTYKADSKELADKLNFEEGVQSYMQAAKQIVEDEKANKNDAFRFTNGFLEEAIKRIKNKA